METRTITEYMIITTNSSVRAFVVTPNLFEAAQLSGVGPVDSIEKMKEAAKAIHEKGAKHVIVKGGSKLGLSEAIDIWYDGETFHELKSELIKTSFTHGAGCTYSAAIAAELAKGSSIEKAIYTAKDFITAAIKHSFRLNEYVGQSLTYK